MFAPLGSFLMLFAAVDVQGDSTCPTVDASRRAVERLLPSEEEEAVTSQIRLTEVPGGVLVERLDGDGAVEATKTLFTKPRACEAAADEVALVVALWAARLDSGVGLNLPAPPSPPPQPARPDVVARAAPPPPARARAAVIIDVLASALATEGGTSWAPAAALTGQARKSGGRWGVAASLLWTGHAESNFAGVPGARVRWQQISLSAGPQVAVPLGFVNGYVDVQPYAGLLSISGSGFDRDVTSSAVDVGVRGGIGVTFGRSRLRPWLGTLLAARVRRQEVWVRGQSESQQLPLGQVLFGCGVMLAGAP